MSLPGNALEGSCTTSSFSNTGGAGGVKACEAGGAVAGRVKASAGGVEACEAGCAVAGRVNASAGGVEACEACGAVPGRVNAS